jgi:hypothetical protein
MNRIILTADTDFIQLIDSDVVTAYHSSGYKNLTPYPNMHCGDLKQALYRADYKMNDECLYNESYIYALDISLKGLSNELILDRGFKQDLLFEDSFKKEYNVLCYKNISEGDVYKNNLSLIVLNTNNILSMRIDNKWRASEVDRYLFKTQNKK